MAYHGLRIRHGSGDPDDRTRSLLASRVDSLCRGALRLWRALRRAVRPTGRRATRPRSSTVSRARSTPRTRAVAVTWVHSSTGVKIPIGPSPTPSREPIAAGRPPIAACSSSTACTASPIRTSTWRRLGCDFFASGTHKWLFAPRGTGFLWGRTDAWPELQADDPDIRSRRPADLGRLDGSRRAAADAGGVRVARRLSRVRAPAGDPAAVELHRAIGRDRIAARIRDLNAHSAKEPPGSRA